jgi:hypothetical protein
LGVHFFSISVFSISAFLFHSRYGVGWDTGFFSDPPLKAAGQHPPRPSASMAQWQRVLAT